MTGVTITTTDGVGTVGYANDFIVSGRWYWTADRADLVREGDSRAAFLAYPDGELISDEEARRTGIAAKMAAPTADKMQRPLKTK